MLFQIINSLHGFLVLSLFTLNHQLYIRVKSKYKQSLWEGPKLVYESETYVLSRQIMHDKRVKKGNVRKNKQRDLCSSSKQTLRFQLQGEPLRLRSINTFHHQYTQYERINATKCYHSKNKWHIYAMCQSK